MLRNIEFEHHLVRHLSVARGMARITSKPIQSPKDLSTSTGYAIWFVVLLMLAGYHVNADDCQSETIDAAKIDEVKSKLVTNYLADFQAKFHNYFAGLGVSDDELPANLDPIMNTVLECTLVRLKDRACEYSLSFRSALDEFVSADAGSRLTLLPRTAYKEDAEQCARDFMRLLN